MRFSFTYKTIPILAIALLLCFLTWQTWFRYNRDDIWFMGHIRFYNLTQYSPFREPYYEQFINNYHTPHPLDYMIQTYRTAPVKRVIFGGDSYAETTPASVAHIALLSHYLPTAHFIPGNHELYFRQQDPLFHQIYDQPNQDGKPYGYEDLNGVRLVYLNTYTTDKVCTLTEEQVQFLKTALSPSQPYRYALVFMHHLLWINYEDYYYAYIAYPPGMSLTEKRRVFPSGNGAYWKETIIPILKQGRVKGVFGGDVVPIHYVSNRWIDDIPHYQVAWWFNHGKIQLEWVGIRLAEDHIELKWHLYRDGKDYIGNSPIMRPRRFPPTYH